MSTSMIIFRSLICAIPFISLGNLHPSMAADESDRIMGIYEGIIVETEDECKQARALVVAEGEGKYRAVVETLAGDPIRFEMKRNLEEKEVIFKGKDGESEWRGKITKGIFVADALTGKQSRFILIQTDPHSPTEGLKPPEGAVILLPFEEGKPTSLDAWQNKDWKCLPDGSVQVTRGGNRTIREHGSGLFHVEFKTPYQPTARGQGRGNSGVYFESRYEIQILDSFGLVPQMGDCGSLYGVAITRENLCFPPLSWQTYDVIFHAPHTNEEGKLEPAVMTVFHNGVKIHENQPVPGPTTAAPGKGNALQGPLFLQDHGNPVCFRNIWYLELPEPD